MGYEMCFQSIQGLDDVLDILRAAVEDADTTGKPQPQAIEALRRSGYLGALIPQQYGGLGQDAVFASRLIERLATVDGSTAIILFQHLATTARVLEWGTQAQLRRFLPLLASGEWLAASAWSESGAGANKQNIATKGTRLPDGTWRLDGAKTFTTGAGLANLYLVLVQTGERGGHSSTYGSAGQSFFLVEADRPGIRPTVDPNLAGMRGSSTGFVDLDGCLVPADCLLGPLGAAPQIIARVREAGLSLGAVSVGIAQAALDLALAHVRKRGLRDQQAIRFRLADMQQAVEAARALVTCAARRESSCGAMLTLHSKVFASEMSERVCREAQQIIGGGGFLRSHPIERLARDARAIALMGPVNDLARELAGQELLKEI
jgi:alkylation response protein AidB-like acyl-CoA dehydrogenase